MQLAKHVPADAVVVLEWIAQLSDSYVLDHTLEHVASMPAQVRLARWINWGFTFVPLHHFVDDDSLANGQCKMQVTWKPADLEMVAIKNVAIESKTAVAAAAVSQSISEARIEQTWTAVPSKRLNKILTAIRKMVERGESSV